MSTRGMCAAIVALVALSASAGCAFSSYQTAKMLPQGTTRVGGGISFYSLQADMGSGDTQGYELMGSHGLSDKMELGGKFVFMRESEMDLSVNVFTLNVVPKYSLMPEKLALTLESGITLVSTSEEMDEVNNGWQTMPGVVFTQTLNEMFDLNIAGKAVLQFEDDFGDHNFAVAGNIGLRLLIPDSAVVVFPELGIMWDDDQDEGYFMQFGIAVQYTLGGAPAPVMRSAPPPADPLPPPPADPLPPPPPPSDPVPPPAPAPVP